jgi:isoquinoline 1-oxidoreductase subunit beta
MNSTFKAGRRTFLLSSAVVVGGGAFALHSIDSAAASAAASEAASLTTGANEHSFNGWLKMANDGAITVYSPHIDFGQGTHTALAQMLADELDADWAQVKVEAAPAEGSFANALLARGYAAEEGGWLNALANLSPALVRYIARQSVLQSTAGSSAIRYTGHYGMRVLGAASRDALLTAAAARLKVPRSELVAANSVVSHPPSGGKLHYGELAADAARESLSRRPTLKTRAQFKLIGQALPRLDVPAKVDGTAVFGIDLKMPELRVAVVHASPVAGGKLRAFNAQDALAVPGVEKLVTLGEAVAVVANGYWPALKGLKALKLAFDTGAGTAVSSAGILQAQRKLTGGDRLQPQGFALRNGADANVLEAEYQVPFLHQAPMEPLNLTAHFKDGTLSVWGGLQDPLNARSMLAEAAKLPEERVRFVPTLMGGGFGRRFPHRCPEIIAQIALLAPQLSHPVKLIWPREEDFAHNGYRPQASAVIKATLSKDGKMLSWHDRYAQTRKDDNAAAVPYTVRDITLEHQELASGVSEGAWRSVNQSQQGFFTESMVDELAQLARQDPLLFRLNHLPASSRAAKVLLALRHHAQWDSPAPAGVGRGLATVPAVGSVAAMVVEVALDTNRALQLRRVVVVVDCGLVVDPRNAQAQVVGGVLMGLSATLGEAITFKDGAAQQTSFADYPIMRLAQVPKLEVHFVPSDDAPTGLGEVGVPPTAAALCNAIFQLTGKRIRQLPVAKQYV